ncbi:MAG: lysostaphin resistance A-like protein [Saprospiraceae bacterium]
MAGTIIAQLAVLGILMLNGYSIDELGQGLPSLGLSAGVLAAVIGISQLLSYLVPGLVSAKVLYPQTWLKELTLDKAPDASKLLMGVLAFVLTLGFTGALASMNASVDLPEWATSIEGDIAGVLDTLITSSSWPTFALVLVIIGILPALGEEIIFRGLIQPSVIRSTGSSHFGIWVTALMFGLVHMQFAGILPRVFLGAVLGFLAYYSQRLWIPIVVHFLFNGLQALAVRLSWMDVEQAAEATDKVDTWQVLATMVVAATALYFFLPLLKPKEGLPLDEKDELTDHLLP